ncbi:unnamed protein product [Triticum turgidum subsp. durum]|uniref:Uncharacterized protein n=1 Tax=Triticum turgidum subsp. durum TaxID=4567 RepID=A0A9R0VMJ7_TRITD|nr:unnamed protein product [Triticum turgidum subsp. durum]
MQLNYYKSHRISKKQKRRHGNLPNATQAIAESPTSEGEIIQTPTETRQQTFLYKILSFGSFLVPLCVNDSGNNIPQTFRMENFTSGKLHLLPGYKASNSVRKHPTAPCHQSLATIIQDAFILASCRICTLHTWETQEAAYKYLGPSIPQFIKHTTVLSLPVPEQSSI